MNVLHITNEFTKKNFSISSLILYISNFLYKNYQFNFSILASSSEKDLFDKKNISIFDFDSWTDYFFKQKDLIHRISNYDVVHIHGIWAPIQFISLVICIKMKKQCLVHPHGMLLNEAIHSGGLIKLIFKKISLFFLRGFIHDNIKFISITFQETQAIKKYFPKTKITEISNPIPFEYQDVQKDFKKKNMVYFGRIHPHKNIHLMIQAFLNANLNSDWSLEIYGIRDDEKYYTKLKKIIKPYSNIKIKDPVFGNEKQNIMQEAWINILVSKSEVLSLSILESSVHGLPSLVNENIETVGLEDSVYTTNINSKNISEKIFEISNWTLEERIQNGKNISTNVKNKTSIDIVSSKYKNLYQEILENKKIEDNIVDERISYDGSLKSLIEKNFYFLLISSTYTFNLMFASFLVVVLVVLGHFSVAGELGLVTSFWISLTQIFSSNMRSIIVSEQNKNHALITMSYRIIFSIFALFIFYFITTKILNFENQKLINVISLLILIQWINEMNLVQDEIKNKFGLFKILSFLNVITITITGVILYFAKFEHLTIIILIYAVFVFLSFSKHFLNLLKTFTSSSIRTIARLNLKTIAFLSSSSIIISSFAWRIMIYYIFDKSLAGVFFACFSIGSFPGTLFNAVIGPAFVKQKITISKKLKNLLYAIFVFIFSLSIFSIYMLINISDINFLGKEFILFTISVSLIGSYFMSYAMYLRHKKIQSSFEERMFLFKRDIFYGLSITFLIPVLYFMGGTIGVSLTFFFASLMAMVFYTYGYKISETNKNI